MDSAHHQRELEKAIAEGGDPKIANLGRRSPLGHFRLNAGADTGAFGGHQNNLGAKESPLDSLNGVYRTAESPNLRSPDPRVKANG